MKETEKFTRSVQGGPMKSNKIITSKEEKEQVPVQPVSKPVKKPVKKS